MTILEIVCSKKMPRLKPKRVIKHILSSASERLRIWKKTDIWINHDAFAPWFFHTRKEERGQGATRRRGAAKCNTIIKAADSK